MTGGFMPPASVLFELNYAKWSNNTFFIEALKADTTESLIVDKLLAKYDVDRATAEKDVAHIISKLDEIGTIIKWHRHSRTSYIFSPVLLTSKSPILFLDEATSALDENTEKKLLQNFRSMTDKTVVIVTHRPAVLEICNRVIDFTDLQSNN